ncbi:biotin/lipoyl-binding protein, partial [Paracoccus sp. APAP_BH8]|uniref:biotin/lipoyl-binding protein n=1 Tax=Paracoccus sp. APAP_BH8 TaxID=3110237 RepID=UPI002FD817FD
MVPRIRALWPGCASRAPPGRTRALPRAGPREAATVMPVRPWPTLEEGTLAKWLVKEGDSVKSGDIIAEI